MPARPAKTHLARLLARLVRRDRGVVYDIGEDLVLTGHIAHDGETRRVRPCGNFAGLGHAAADMLVAQVLYNRHDLLDLVQVGDGGGEHGHQLALLGVSAAIGLPDWLVIYRAANGRALPWRRGG